MRHILTTVVLAGALIASSAAFAQTSTKPSTTKPAPAAKSTAPAKSATTHSVEGVVKSVDATSMVITRAGKTGGDMTFSLDSSTKKDGTIASGSNVSVRYHTEGTNNIATAVKAEAPKVAKTKK